MKELALILVFAFLGFLLNGQTNPQPSKEDLEKLDFWVGTWDLTWEGGKGRNVIEKILDGRVIQENFESLEGNNTGYKGMSVSTYNPADGQWHQAWVDNQGGYIDFTGIMDGDTRIFQLTNPITQADGTEFTSRMRFYEITEDSFMWDWERSTDEGKNWTLSWRIKYERVGHDGE